jgi:pimeloyl-ACP methyl ester carboxylesterase
MSYTYPVLNATEQPVSFTNQGERLWGMLHLPHGDSPHPAVLFLHGITGDKTGAHRLFVHAARALAARGIASLRFDMRGSGDSEGEFQDMTLAAEVSDAQAALEWLIAHPSIDAVRVGTLGLSLGGMVASILAGRNPNLVNGMALWAAAANADVFMHMAERTSQQRDASTDTLMASLLQNGYIMLWGFPCGLPFIQTFFHEQPMEELQNYRGKAIIIHNTGDPTVPISQADVYAEHFGPRAQVYKLDDSTHTFEPPPIERQVIDLTVDWFKALFG